MIVDKIKDSILSYAISGKLTQELDSDSNVNDYYEEFGKELKNTYNYDKINKSLLPISEENAKLGKTKWKRMRLGSIIRINSGQGLTSKNMNIGNIPVYGGNGVTGYHDMYNVDEPTLVIGRVGYYCGVCHITPEFAWVTDNAFITTYPKKYFFQKYLYYLLNATNLSGHNNGTAQPVISGAKIYNIVVDVPPIEEQQRIVDKIEELFAKLNEVKPIEEDIKKLKVDFSKDLRKSLIQSAVSGKLTNQKNSENTLDVLEEIETKLGKKITNIDNYPFELPNNWVWIKLGELVSFNIGKTPPRSDSSYWSKDRYHWISISDMVENGFIDNTKEYVSEKAYKEVFKEKISEKGTLLMSFKLTVGRCSILKIDAFHNEGIISIYPNYKSNILKEYLFKILPFMTRFGKTKGAIKGNTLNSKSLNNLLIPLPPIEEQQRIVDKLEKLLPLCDDIERLVGES